MGLLKAENKTRVYILLMYLLAFSIPLHKTFSSTVILLLMLFWLFESSPGRKIKNLLNPSQTGKIIGFSILYLVYVGAVFYSQDIFRNAGTQFTLQVKASLLIFPLFFATAGLEGFKPDFLINVLKVFLLGCLLSSIIISGNAIYRFFAEGFSTGVFFYTQLSLNHHPSYLSLIFSFAIAFLLYRLLFDEELTSRGKTFSILLIIYFQFVVVLLSSKAGIIGLFILYSGFIIFVTAKHREIAKKSLYIGGSMTFLFLAFLIINPTVRGRFIAVEKSMKSDLVMQTDSIDSSVARILIWKSALELIAENPVLGVGTGDVRAELVKKYQKRNIVPAIENEYNAHNQYLQDYLAAGIPGLMTLLGCLIAAFFIALKTGNLLYFLFTLLFSFHILVESMLERQAGVVFYAFFNALLFYAAIVQKKGLNH